jgi:hypothetical protein
MHGRLGRRKAADRQGHETVLRVRRNCVFQRKQDLLQVQEISAEGEVMDWPFILMTIIVFAVYIANGICGQSTRGVTNSMGTSA